MVFDSFWKSPCPLNPKPGAFLAAAVLVQCSSWSIQSGGRRTYIDSFVLSSIHSLVIAQKGKLQGSAQIPSWCILRGQIANHLLRFNHCKQQTQWQDLKCCKLLTSGRIKLQVLPLSGQSPFYVSSFLGTLCCVLRFPSLFQPACTISGWSHMA